MDGFHQIEWDAHLDQDCRRLVQLALAEDLNGEKDWTTVALVPADREGSAAIIAREAGVAAGLKAVSSIIAEAQSRLSATSCFEDGEPFETQARLAEIHGNVRDLLTLERTLLNILGRLMGIASLTTQYVGEVAGTKARVYDTRKTTPGWRRLEKYAVRCGGGCNHRTGLFDAVLIKDNHLAQWGRVSVSVPSDVATAVEEVRKFLKSPQRAGKQLAIPIEVEVDSLEQLDAVLAVEPDIVLLDNMKPEQLGVAVDMRNSTAPNVQLEASGGVRLDTIREIATTGVDRISVGALTHSARVLDIGLDWQAP